MDGSDNLRDFIFIELEAKVRECNETNDELDAYLKIMLEGEFDFQNPAIGRLVGKFFSKKKKKKK